MNSDHETNGQGQDPEEVKEEQKHEEIKPYGFSTAVKYLLILNGIIFGLTYLWASYFDWDLFSQFALHHPKSPLFEWYQFITYMFLHGSVAHIFLNMFVLWMFGNVLEQTWGIKKFLLYYFITGIGAAGLHMAVTTYTLNQLEKDVSSYVQDPGFSDFTSFVDDEIGEIPDELPSEGKALKEIKELRQEWREEPESEAYAEESKDVIRGYYNFAVNRPSVGASGAIFGVLVAFGVIFPNVLIFLYFLFPIKAKYFVVIIGLLELYFGIMGQQTGVANFAHLGGMLVGFILLKIWGEKPRKIKQ